MNKVILLGRLTKDPEVRYTQTNNTLVASFSIAVNRRFTREGDTTNADFFNCVAWSKVGEFVSKYFKKGQQIALVGRLQNRSWDDQQGQRHYITEVIVEETYFADSKRNGDSGDNTFSSFAEQNSTTDGTNNSASDSDIEISSGNDLPF